jgi:hypothetical protein
MSDPKHDERHDSVWLLLPWYANGTLETAERLLVEDHLAGCPSCREEVARCNGLAAALRDRPEIAPSPHPLQLARLMERLDAPDAGDADDAGEAGDASDRGDAGEASAARQAADAGARFRKRGAPLLGGTPRLVRWVLAGQLAAVILLATALTFGPARRFESGKSGSPGAARPAQHAGADFITLAAPSAQAGSLPAPAATPQIHVVFVDTATARQMKEVLLSIRGRLVDGPSPLGAYTLELPAPAPAAAAPPAGGFQAAGTGDLAPAPSAPRAALREAPPDSVGIVLAYLRSQPIVRFAEPVAGTDTGAPAAPAQGAATAPQGAPGSTPGSPPS